MRPCLRVRVRYLVRMRELRRALRVCPPPDAPVRVDVMGSGFLEVLFARDISVGGVGVFVPHDFVGCNTDNDVELIITIGSARPFKTRGRIRHRSHSETAHFYGIEFLDLRPEQRALIEDYVSSCSRRGRELP
nr:MAG: hypothetical protein DIU78_05100 [Pseudomonadota bacterium]